MQGNRKAIAHIFSTEGMDARDLRAAMRSKCARGASGPKLAVLRQDYRAIARNWVEA